MDDEDEEEHEGYGQVRTEAESHETAPPDAVQNAMEEPSNPCITSSEEASAAKASSESTDPSNVVANPATETPGTTNDGEKKEDRKAAEAEREAVAAAHNLALLPDEPLDRLSSIIGTAMQHGKTVVYSVIRSAARQPNGDLLIPVVGGSMALGFDQVRHGEGLQQKYPLSKLLYIGAYIITSLFAIFRGTGAK